MFPVQNRVRQEPSVFETSKLDVSSLTPSTTSQELQLHARFQSLQPAKVLPLAPDEQPRCRTIPSTNGMRFPIDALPRALILCPQGAITFQDDKQCLGIGGSDFGGQLVYIKELATSLKQAGFPAVDIVTRRFQGEMANGKEWPQEFGDTFETLPGDNDVRVVRLPCGGDTFMPKEQLWRHLPEWTSNIAHFYEQEAQTSVQEKLNTGLSSELEVLSLEATQSNVESLADSINEEARTPLDFRQLRPVVTAHYGDAGMAGYLLEKNAQFPLATMTAHSLGAQKKANLSEQQRDLTPYSFQIRLPAERKAARSAGAIICNSPVEKEVQWTDPAYLNAAGQNADKCHVIPPGIAPVFWKPAADTVETNPITLADKREASTAFAAAVKSQIPDNRRNLPTILLCGRLDRKKGYKQTLEAFAQSPSLQSKANLAIIFGNAPAIFANPMEKAEGDTQKYVQEMNVFLNQTSLQGKLIIPNIPEVRQAHLAQIYHELSQDAKGIYCHSAFQEPFGLALTEAMAGGMLVAATDNGGPVSILEEGALGELMNVKEPASIEAALHKLLDRSDESRQALQLKAQDKAMDYSWKKTGEEYAKLIVTDLAKRYNPGN